MTPEPASVVRGYPAIAAVLAGYGPAFRFDRHQLYRLSQRTDHPLPVDGPVGMPAATRTALAEWVAGERRRSRRRP